MPASAAPPAAGPSPPLSQRSRLTGAVSRQDVLCLVPATLAIGVMIAWAASGGGYQSQPAVGTGFDPNPWYLGALGVLGVAYVTLVGLRRPWERMAPAIRVALCAFAVYVVWSYASILWADDQGSALVGSNRTLIYLALFALFAILPWTARALSLALAVFVAGIGVLAIVTAAKVGSTAHPASLYVSGGRLLFPLGYENASAALFMLTALVSVALCARRDAPAALRVMGLGVAGLCLQLAVLSQSRGWLFTAPLVLLAALAVISGRLRFILFALGPAAAAAGAAPALLNVYGKSTPGGNPLPQPRLDQVLARQGAHASHVMLVADLILLAAMAGLVMLDRRIEVSPAIGSRLNRLAALATALAVAGGIAVGLAATHGHPIRRLEHAWRSFANTSAVTTGSSRFENLGSTRVDFWRVALDEFKAHPLIGIGQDNYADAYLVHRRSNQEPRWTHSWELRLLTHTGLIGALAFLVFLGAALIAALRSAVGPARRAVTGIAPGERMVIGAALMPATVWLVHGSLDWFWEFPALTGPALAFLGAAAALGRPGRLEASAEPAQAGAGPRQATTPSRPPRRTVPRLAAMLAPAVIAIPFFAVLAIPYIAARDVQRALHVWSTSPAAAYVVLHRATDLVPIDPETYLVGGAIALNSGQNATAVGWFQSAARHDDRQWLAPFALGLLASEQGDRTKARNDYTRAHMLNPGETLVIKALARVNGRHPLTLNDVAQELASRQTARFGR